MSRKTTPRAASNSSMGAPGLLRISASLTADLDAAFFRAPFLDRMERTKRSVPGVRKWLRFEAGGRCGTLHADKYNITEETGVQLRDLRLLDPQLATSYPSAILARERALVVNLEYIKCIITQDCVLVLNPEDDQAVGYVEQLSQRLAPPYEADGSRELRRKVSMEGTAHVGHRQLPRVVLEESPFELRALEVCLDLACAHLSRLASDLEAAAHPALDALTRKVTTGTLERVRRIKTRLVRLKTRVETMKELLEKLLADNSDMKALNLTAKQAEQHQRMAQLQQRSMEVAIAEEDPDRDSATRGTSAAPSVDADPADADVTDGTTVDPVALAAPDLLPSFSDLLALDRGADSQPAPSPPSAQPVPVPPRQQSPADAAPQPSPAADSSHGRGHNGGGGGGGGFSWPPPGREYGGGSLPSMLRRQSGSVLLGSTQSQVAATATTDELGDAAVDLVEQLLEAYFMQVTSTENKLSTLYEYVDDTEDYVEIQQDNRRNQLIKLDLLTTAAMISLSFVTVITGFYAMNLRNGPWQPNGYQHDFTTFYEVTFTSIGLAILSFIAFLWYCWSRKLIFQGRWSLSMP